MSAADIILVAIIAAAVLFALIRIKKKGTGCSCGSGGCSACPKKDCQRRGGDSINNNMV